MSYFIDVSVTFVISGDLKFLEIKYMMQNIREACTSLSCVRLRIKIKLMCALLVPTSQQHPKMQQDDLERNLEMPFIKKKSLNLLLNRNCVKECFKTAVYDIDASFIACFMLSCEFHYIFFLPILSLECTDFFPCFNHKLSKHQLS